VGILSEVEEAMCIWWLAYGLDESGSVLIIWIENILLSSPSFLVVTPCLECTTNRWSFWGEISFGVWS